MDQFRILSLDGGGLRGIIPVLVIKEIERRTGKRITDLFDMIAGTSTGALIACGLTVSDNNLTPKYTIEDIEKIYVDRGKEIFPKRSWLKNIVMGVSSLKKPKYSANGLQKVLEDLLGDKRLDSCVIPVFATSYDLYHNEAVLFKTRQALSNPARNAKLVDVCRSTSAAPTYLPAYTFRHDNKQRTCIDGGVFMNNPAVGALVEISKSHRERPYNRQDLKWDDIKVLSLGTGHYSSEIAKKKVEDFGLLDWAANITDVMMQAVNQTTSYESAELLSTGNFLRLDLDIMDERYSDMADSSDESREYLIREVKSQIISNGVLMSQLDAFFK